MATTNQKTFAQIMGDLKKGIYAPVYVLMGEEPFFIDRISDYIEKNVLAEEDTFFNQDVVYGLDTTAVQLADMARAFPMPPAKHRVVVVKEAQNLRSLDALATYLDNPVADNLLVICYKNGTIDGRKKFLAKARQVGVVFESKKKRESELPSFIENYLSERKTTIERKATEMIADHIGADLNRIASELDKLLVGMNDEAGRRITPDIVEQKIGISKEFNLFELRTAVANHDVTRVNRIVDYYNKNPKAGSLFACLPILFSYFQNLMVAHYTPNKQNPQALITALGFYNQWQLIDYTSGMRNYSPLKTMQIIEKIRDIDARSKGLDNASTPPTELFTELTFFILH